MNKLLIGLITIAILSGIGWFIWQNSTSNTLALSVLHNKVPYDVTYEIDDPTPAVGDTVTMRMKFKLNGQPIDLEAEEIYPHASIVSNNLGDVWFYHIDEVETIDTGVYEFTHTFDQASNYTIWVEVNNNQTVDYSNISKVL